MKNMRIATLHSLEKDLAQGTMKDAQDLLDDFLQKEGIIPEHSYHIVENLVSDSSAPVYEALLRDASLGRFDLLLVKSFEQIAPCDERRLPRLLVFSLEDQEMREIGTLDQPLAAAEKVDRVANDEGLKQSLMRYAIESGAITEKVYRNEMELPIEDMKRFLDGILHIYDEGRTAVKMGDLFEIVTEAEKRLSEKNNSVAP